MSLWTALGGEASLLDRLETSGPPDVLPSRFDVTGFATETTGLATLAAAELLAARSARAVLDVSVDSVDACAAFKSETLLQPLGWERPPVWDAIAGDYRAKDRYLRIHTNYASHRAALLRVLGVREERAAVRDAIAASDAEPLESAIVEAGGCAAAMYTTSEWAAHAHGSRVRDEPAIATFGERALAAALPPWTGGGALEGIRVLDLTRVIAGPVCTRVLAAHGADVLRLDPPGFEEMKVAVPDMTVGKRCATLDLRDPRFTELLAEAHVLVHGLRPGALAGLGWNDAAIRAVSPAIVLATLDAYGWRGPWASRRGFDSLVQTSTGIAAHDDAPSPLPAQALDHGTGYLLAAGVMRALTTRETRNVSFDVRASLLGAANDLVARGPRTIGPAIAFADHGGGRTPKTPDRVFERCETGNGPARRVRYPGTIGGVRPTWRRPACVLGAHEPRFEVARTSS